MSNNSETTDLIIDNKWPSNLSEPINSLDTFKMYALQSARTKNGELADIPTIEESNEFFNNINQKYHSMIHRKLFTRENLKLLINSIKEKF